MITIGKYSMNGPVKLLEIAKESDFDKAYRMFEFFASNKIEIDGCGCCDSPAITFEGEEFASARTHRRDCEVKIGDARYSISGLNLNKPLQEI